MSPALLLSASEETDMQVSQDILIVDDEVTIVEFMTEALIDEGYSVRSAYDGESALAEIAMSPPAVVLLDLHLQDISGIELLERLHSQGCSDLRVVLMTADIKAARELAAQGKTNPVFLFKPFTIDDLFDLVAQYVSPQRGPQE
jgi:two-component system, OmpR family, response regulator